jgi:hypothetical protein
MRVPCSGFSFFADQKRRLPPGGDGGSSFFTSSVWKLILGKPCRPYDGAEARGILKPHREVADLEEADDPVGFGTAIGIETA